MPWLFWSRAQPSFAHLLFAIPHTQPKSSRLEQWNRAWFVHFFAFRLPFHIMHIEWLAHIDIKTLADQILRKNDHIHILNAQFRSTDEN